MIFVPVESEDESTIGKDDASRRQLQLQSHCSFHARNHILHFQRHQTITGTKQPSSLGSWNIDMAADSPVVHRVRFTCDVTDHHIYALETRSQAGGEGSSLLYCFRRCLLRFQHHHVGHWCRDT